MKPDPLAYDNACQPLLQKYMVADKGNGRRHIPAETYGAFLEELRPIWEEHLGPWEGGQGKLDET